MASSCFQYTNIPAVLSEFLGEYLRTIEHPRLAIKINKIHDKDFVKNRLKDYLAKIKVRYPNPPMMFLSNAIKSDIRLLYKNLGKTPIGCLSDKMQVNALIMMVWYTKVGNTKGDRDWILREFYKQYAYAYTAVKFNRLRKIQ
jgi:hypothetical protein